MRLTPFAGEPPEAYAALDLGTNNCRLLVARVQRDGEEKPTPRVVDSFSRIIRLGEGVSNTGQLTEDAMQRAIDALRICRSKIDRHALRGWRYVATEACRRARNTPEFLARVAAETGIEIDVISAEEEARLALMGCVSLLRKSEEKHAIVFDIGGGSTEFLWVTMRGEHEAPDVHDWLSLPVGVMNLSERFGDVSVAEWYFEDMVSHIMALLEPFDSSNAIAGRVREGGVQLLSTSGTVTTLAAVYKGLPRYDRSVIDGIRVPTEAIRAAGRRLLAMRPSERFLEPCVGGDRSDFIIFGSAIFEAVMRLWPIEQIRVADRGVREGIILTLLEENAHGAR